MTMSKTLDVLINVISDVCGKNASELRPEQNAIDDLAIDSVDMLDIMYELNRRYEIKIPAERWSSDITAGAAKSADYFVLERFAGHIDALVREKAEALGSRNA
jgi:acyl carrier protein